MKNLKIIGVLSVALLGVLSLSQVLTSIAVEPHDSWGLKLPHNQVHRTPVLLKDNNGMYLAVDNNHQILYVKDNDEATLFTKETNLAQIVPAAIGAGGLASTLIFKNKFLTNDKGNLILSKTPTFWKEPDHNGPMAKLLVGTISQGGLILTQE